MQMSTPSQRQHHTRVTPLLAHLPPCLPFQQGLLKEQPTSRLAAAAAAADRRPPLPPGPNHKCPQSATQCRMSAVLSCPHSTNPTPPPDDQKSVLRPPHKQAAHWGACVQSRTPGQTSSLRTSLLQIFPVSGGTNLSGTTPQHPSPERQKAWRHSNSCDRQVDTLGCCAETYCCGCATTHCLHTQHCIGLGYVPSTQHCCSTLHEN